MELMSPYQLCRTLSRKSSIIIFEPLLLLQQEDLELSAQGGDFDARPEKMEMLMLRI